MAGTVSFKVYMSTEDDSPKEVRRFGVEADVVTNFVYLREKLQTIFPKLRGKHFTVSWKDADNDNVIISSDEELQIALEEDTSSSDIRKLYVVLHSEYETPSDNPTFVETNNAGPIHVGVICDGCDKQIQGFRYKCVQCANYDLCVDCETHGAHPEHCMIRLSMPLQWKPHYGRRLATQVNRLVKKSAKEAHSRANKDDETKQQCPFKTGSGKHHGKSRHAGNNAPSWIDTFATYLDDWANLPGECPMKEAAKEATEVPTQDTASSNEAKASSQQRDNDKSPAEQIRLLTNVGLAVGENFLSQFLDPLVNMQAKNEKSTTTAPAAPTTTSTSASASASASDSASASTSVSPNNEKEAAAESSSRTDETSKFPGEGKKLRETSSKDDDDFLAFSRPNYPQSSTEKVSAEKVYFENEGWTLLNKVDSPTPGVTLSSSNGAVPKQVQPSAPVDASAASSIYPKLPEVPQKKPDEIPILYHPNPTIQKSVESMIAMGFSNEGGWLTNLLISKSGDIAAALDALSPVKR